MFCKQCGCELSEDSAVCPKCGRVSKIKIAEEKRVSIQQEKPVKKAGGHKFIIIAAAAVAAVAAVVLIIVLGNSPEITPNKIPSGSTILANTIVSNKSEDLYKVKLKLSVEKNVIFARYGVDVIINGVTVKTLNQGETFEREIEVEKGCFSIKFVKNRSTSDETLNFGSNTVDPAEYTEYVDRDCEISLKIKTHKLSIEVL